MNWIGILDRDNPGKSHTLVVTAAFLLIMNWTGMFLFCLFQVCDGQPTKATRMMQAEEAVSRIKVNLNDICNIIIFIE